MTDSLQNQLFSAIKDNNAEEVSTVLSQHADPNALFDGISPFHACVQLGNKLDPDILDALIEGGGNINTLDATGKTPLDAAMEFEALQEGMRFNPESRKWEPFKEMKLDPPAQTIIALYERNAKATDHELRIGDIRDAMLDKELLVLRHWNHLAPHLRELRKRFIKKGLEHTLPQQVIVSDTLLEGPNGTSYYDTPYTPLPAPENGREDPLLPFIKCLNYTGMVTNAVGARGDLDICYGFMETICHDWEKAAKDLAKLAQDADISEEMRGDFIQIRYRLALFDIVRSLHPDILHNLDEQTIYTYLQEPNAHSSFTKLFFEGKTPEEAIATIKTVSENFAEIKEILDQQKPDIEKAQNLSYAVQLAGVSRDQMTPELHQILFDILTGMHVNSPLHESNCGKPILAERYAGMPSVNEVMEACGFRDHLRRNSALEINEDYQRDLQNIKNTGIVMQPDVKDITAAAKQEAEKKEAENKNFLPPLHKHRFFPLTKDEVSSWAGKVKRGDLDAAIADLTADYYQGKATKLEGQGKSSAANETRNRIIEERQAASNYRQRIQNNTEQNGHQL